jgi:hypothetical protein
MSRITELKKQNEILSMSLIDIFNLLTKKSKYTELIINLAKNKLSNYDENHRFHLIADLTRYFDEEFLQELSTLDLLHLHRSIVDFVGENNLDTFVKFIELNERKLIEKNDLTTYKDFDDVISQISLSEIKLMGKEIENQVIKLFENNEWLILKPLSLESSRKYGANTRWCTASKHTPEQFYNYSKRGIIIYTINKLTGNKVAAFKNLDISYEKKEISFWDVIDNRIDSMESGLDEIALNVIRKEFNNCLQTNWELVSEEEKRKQFIWEQSERDKIMLDEPVRMIRLTDPAPMVEESPNQPTYDINTTNIA